MKKFWSRFQIRRQHMLTLAFFAGFIVDNLTLDRVDNLIDSVILASYVVLMLIAMLLLYASTAGKMPERITPFVQTWSAPFMQFAFGGLLSGMLIFYGRSGSFAASWPFMLIIVSVIAGNELVKQRAQQLIFNLSVLFIGLFSYLILVVPVLIGRMGDVVFVLSSVLALIIFIVYVRLLGRIIPNFLKLHIRGVTFAVLSLFIAMHTLYFTNTIPPIPLSLKDIGIYHKVERLTDGRYLVTREEQPWYRWYRDDDTYFRTKGTTPVYCYTSVFAPTRFVTNIYHRWQQYNEASGEWEYRARINYPIIGGQDGGYRGYTYMTVQDEGKYRCIVENERGQRLGTRTFTVHEETPKALIVETR